MPWPRETKDNIQERGEGNRLSDQTRENTEGFSGIGPNPSLAPHNSGEVRIRSHILV